MNPTNVFLTLLCLVCAPSSAVAQVLEITDTSRPAWKHVEEPTAPTGSYRIELFLKANVDGQGVPMGQPINTIDAGKPVPDANGDYIGPPLKPFLVVGNQYIAFVRAIAASDSTLWSARSNPTVVFALPTPPNTTGCTIGGTTHAITIAVQDYTKTVLQGGRGRVNFTVANSYPVTKLQVRLGPQVVGEIVGQELRDIVAIGFSVPRIAATHQLTVFAEDSVGCSAVTTAARPMVVQ